MGVIATPRTPAISRQAPRAERKTPDISSFDVRVYDRVAAVPQHIWDGLFPGAAEDWTYYRAIEDCPPGNFRFGVIAALRGEAVLAAAPIFRTTYELHTSLQGRIRRVADRFASHAPRLFQLPVMVLGSPLLDRCDIGFGPAIGVPERRHLMGALLDGLRQAATKERITLLGLKDVSDRDSLAFHSVLSENGFARMTNVPMTYIDMPYRNEEDYLAHLPDKTASYLRRKLRTLSRIKVEYRDSVEGLEDELHALYQSTRANSQVQYGDFDELHPRYFQAVLQSCGDKAQLMLCWSGNALVSFQLFMVGDREVVAKFIGMRYPEARELNLYFINWFMMFRFAFERRIRRVRMGNTSYAVKLLLGGHLEKSWIYFRHLNPIVNWAFHRVAPMMDYEKNDPELRKLSKEADSPRPTGHSHKP
jgi:Acetyltransferase (GNAT) domain